MDTPGFLQDDAGHKSTMRVMCLMSLCEAMVLSTLHAFGHGNAETIMLVYGFLTMSVGGKMGQKWLERSDTTTRSS